MEFGYGRRREGYYCEEDRDREDSSSNNHLILIPSSSSATLLHRSFGATASSSNSTPTAEAAPVAAIEKEHMFDKVVTPSDVGKLNRLVIPKQHAERYFPLDASTNEKGLHLNFEDRTGKPWRFRYSYWNSSQSYVMTKGWSRFVKEKRLNAGDTVSFARGVGDSGKGRMFIDWKRRPDIREPPLLQTRNPFSMLPSSSSITYPMVSFSRSAGPWGSPRLLVPNAPAATLYNQHQQMSYGYSNAFSPTAASTGSGSGQYPVFRSAQMQPAPGADATFSGMPMVLDSVPVVNSRQAAAKRVRLFGVNLDFQESDGQHSSQNVVSSQPGTAESSRIFSSSSSSPSPSGKEEHLSLDLDM